LVLRYLEDQSEAQTAEILGWSVGTVKSTTSRALDRLRQELPNPADVDHREAEVRTETKLMFHLEGEIDR
jgi:DNA-directed RNA polymerase specialized sigma24 family protein